MEAWYATLQEYVLNAFGQRGQTWLNGLPCSIDAIANTWHLVHIKPLHFPSHHYVAFCNQAPSDPVVLKISLDTDHIVHEYKVHQHFHGQGVVRVLAYDAHHHAVLLERAVPGDVLRAIDRDAAIAIYTDIIKKVHSCDQDNQQNFAHSHEWLEAIDHIDVSCIEKKYIDFAKKLKMFLLQHKEEEKICHGDLHLGNILLHGDHYVSIDPKGVVGELAFEACAFELITQNELQKKSPLILQDIMQKRIHTLSLSLECDEQRLYAWFYVRSLIYLQRCFEKASDSSEKYGMVKCLYDLKR